MTTHMIHEFITKDGEYNISKFSTDAGYDRAHSDLQQMWNEGKLLAWSAHYIGEQRLRASISA